MRLPKTTQAKQSGGNIVPLYGWRDALLIVALILGAMLLYNTPKLFSVALQILVLLLFARSKKPYYWLAVYMFTVFNPGGLFHIDAPEMLSIIEAPAIGAVTFNMAFAAVAIAKATLLHSKAFYKRYVLIFGAYMVLLIPIFGGRPTYLIRGFLTYSWMLFLPAYMKEEGDFFQMFRLIFLLNLVMLAMNVYQIIQGVPFVHALSSSFFSQQSGRYLFRIQDTEGLVRTSYGVQVAYLAIAGSLYNLTFKKPRFPKIILYASLIIGLFNIISSATRGWMIGILFAVLAYSMFLVPRLFRNLIISVPTVALLVFTLMRIPLIRHQVERSYERFMTVEYVLEGDISAGGTSSRHIRGSRVMSKYYESPVIGYGFGPDTMEYVDGHTGNQTMLLYFGGIGYGLYIILWLVFMLKPILLFTRVPAGSGYRSLVWLPAFLLAGLIIIHSTSGMYLHPFATGIFGAFVFALGNMIYQQALGQIANKPLSLEDRMIAKQPSTDVSVL